MRVTNGNCNTCTRVNFKNIYLDNGRIITQKEVNKTIRKISREASFICVKEDIINFLKRIFNK